MPVHPQRFIAVIFAALFTSLPSAGDAAAASEASGVPRITPFAGPALPSPAPIESARMIPGARVSPWHPELIAMATKPEARKFSPVPGHYGPGPAPRRPQADRGPLIRLIDIEFDPISQLVPGPAALLEMPERSSGMGYVLVQFHGPIRPEWRKMIELHGGEVIDYVPDFAYIVRIANTGRALLSALPELRWVGDYPPLFRLASALVEPALDGRSSQPLALMARGFVGEPADQLLQALIAVGVEVLEVVPDSGGGVIFRLQASSSRLLDMARIEPLAWIEMDYPMTYGNAVARSGQLLRKDQVELALGLYGQGQIVAVADSGLSTGNLSTVHPDFAGRVLGWAQAPNASCAGWADEDSHGTHVAGSVLGSGVRSGANPGANQYSGSHAGLAPRAGLVVFAGCNDLSGIPASNMYAGYWTLLRNFDPELRVTNNSWGHTDPSFFGTYNITARETDRFIRDFPDMVGVFIAQNAGRDANNDGVSDMGTVTPPGTAKNVITVGASENLRASGGFNPGSPNCSSWGSCWPQAFPTQPIRDDRPSDHANGMAAFSGRGPTLSNRLKPDIVAPGTNIISARNESAGTGWGVHNNFYLYMGGTSMAAPLVAGGAAIVREYFQRQFGHSPSAALVKATLINGAVDMAPGQYGTGAQQDVWRRPDIHQGWGRMNMTQTLVFDAPRQPAYFEVLPGVQTGQMLQQAIELVSGGSEMRVTLVWTDAHGLEASHGALVNDLDLEVVDPNGTVHRGSAGMIGVAVDRFNNLEEVRLPSAPAGTYTLRIIGHNVPMGPQPFAVVVTGAMPGAQIFRDRFQS